MRELPSQASRLREFAGWLQRWAAYFQEQAKLAEGRSLDSEPPVPGNAAPESGLPGETPPAGAAGIQSAPGEKHGEPHAPPAHWQELARSAGPPAHWLALFEEDSAGLFSAQNELDDAEAGHQDPAAWFQALQQGTADFLDGGEGLPAVPIGGDPPEPTHPASGEPRLPGAAASAADSSLAPAHTIPRRGEPPMPAQPASGEPRLSDAAASTADGSPAYHPTQAPASATRSSVAPAPSAAAINWTRPSQALAAASDDSPASPISRRGDPPMPAQPASGEPHLLDTAASATDGPPDPHPAHAPASVGGLPSALAPVSHGSPAPHPTQAPARVPASEARQSQAPAPTVPPSRLARQSQAPAAASDGSPASPISRRGDPPVPTRPPASKLRLSIASAADSRGSPAPHPSQAAAQAPPGVARLPAAPSPTAPASPAPASPAPASPAPLRPQAQETVPKARLHIAAPPPISARAAASANHTAPAPLPAEISPVSMLAPRSPQEIAGLPAELSANAQPLPVESRQDMPATSPQPESAPPESAPPESAPRTPETAAPPSDLPPAPASRLPQSSPPVQPPAAAAIPDQVPEWLWPDLPDPWNDKQVNIPSLRTPPGGLRGDAHRRQRLDQEQRGRPWNA